MIEPYYSPWGKVQHCEELTQKVFSVSTASHGGIMADARKARSIFSAEALKCAFYEEGFYCFEEDCAAPVAILELMDKKLWMPPVNEYWKPGAYEKCINNSVQRYYPAYWKARQNGKTNQTAQMSKKDRGDAR